MENTGTEAKTETTQEAAPKTETQEKTFSQADIDRAITKAIQTREQKLKEEFEQQKLVEQHKYKELYEKAEAQKRKLELEQNTVAKLREENDLDYLPIVGEFGDSIEARVELKNKIKQLVSSQVEKQIAERLKTDKPATSTTKTGTTDISKMTPEQYKEYRKTLGIQGR